MGKTKGGVVVEEMTEEDVREMNSDYREDSELEEPTEPTSDDLEGDLQQESEDAEDAEASEPAEDPEVTRLKEAGLYRPGMIEDFETLTKSYKHLEKRFSETRPIKPQPSPEINIDPREIVEELNTEFATNPTGAAVRVFNALAAKQDAELRNLKKELFEQNAPDYGELREEIGDIEARYPGIDIKDAYYLARGKNIDKYKQSAAIQERKRETDRKLAQREKAGGVRTAAPSVEKQLEEARIKARDADEYERLSSAILDRAGMGHKD